MTEVRNNARINYKTIVRDLMMTGKKDLPRWSKEEFIAACELDYGVSNKTAKKVYDAYHEKINAREE